MLHRRLVSDGEKQRKQDGQDGDDEQKEQEWVNPPAAPGLLFAPVRIVGVHGKANRFRQARPMMLDCKQTFDRGLACSRMVGFITLPQAISESSTQAAP